MGAILEFACLGLLPIGCWLLLTRIPADIRFPTGVYVFTYLLTYVVGAIRLLLHPEGVITEYFSGAMWVPDVDEQFIWLWIVVLTPFVVVPLAATMLRSTLFGNNPGAEAPVRPATPRFSFGIFWIWLVLVLLLIALFPIYPAIIEGLLGFFDTRTVLGADISSFYGLRQDVLTDVRAYQAGIMYTALPFTAIVLFLCSTGVKQTFLALLAILLVAVLNLSTMQAGPALFFVIWLTMAWVLYSRSRFLSRSVLIPAAAVAALYLIYQGQKNVDQSIASALNHFLLRMPIALPYLADMAMGKDVGTELTMPAELASYMFGLPFGFAQMPQPAHVLVFFQYGVIGLAFVLVLTAVFTCIAGAAMQTGRTVAGVPAIWIAIAMLPFFYYIGQGGVAGALISSYGIIYSLTPLAVLAVLSNIRRASH